MTDQPNAIPGYEILAKIGEGGRGTVYRARQLSLDRLVAVKILAPELASDAEYTSKFLQEARAAAKLSHPNIVQAIEAGVHNGIWYFVMELVESGSLHERLVNAGKFSEQETLDVARQMAEALDFAWRRAHLVHRDIKPANILLTTEGHTKLADLGLAQRHGTPAEKTGFTEGTPQYCAPEQCRGEANLDIRTDLYSLGATLYHLICGRPPFDGDNPAVVMGKQITDPPPPPLSLNPQISPALEAIILKLLAKDRAQRFQSPAELLKELDRLQTPQRPEPATAALAADRRRFVALVAAGMLGLVLLVVGAVAFFKGPASGGHAKPAAKARSRLAQQTSGALRAPAAFTATQQTAAIIPQPAPPPAASAPPAPPPGPSDTEVQKLLADTAALVKESKFAAAEAAFRKAQEQWKDTPLQTRLKIENAFQETQTARAAYEKKMADEAAAKAAAETARREQAEAQARVIIEPTGGWARAFYIEYACQYMAGQIAKATDADVRARLEARSSELQLLAELKNHLIAEIGKGALPARVFALVRGRTLQGKPVRATADNISIAVGAGTIAVRWSDLTEPTIYALLQTSVTAQHSRPIAALALYAWETGRAEDGKRYYDQAKTALGDQLPEPVRRRGESPPAN
ncbi:MAG: serine/threonine-protein kinase [Verrucomicrobia bacterium]|nr:serine/threonine-protein kinase [Verrucomicrobiota bacterium]